MSAIFEFLFYAIAGLFGLWLACVVIAGLMTGLSLIVAGIGRAWSKVTGKDKG